MWPSWKTLRDKLPYNVKVIISMHLCVLECWTWVCVWVCDSPYHSHQGWGGGTVSSSAARMLFIDRLQILTTCALRHGKRCRKKQWNVSLWEIKFTCSPRSCYVNIHLHHLFASQCQIGVSHVHRESGNTGANYIYNHIYMLSVSLRLNCSPRLCLLSISSKHSL